MYKLFITYLIYCYCLYLASSVALHFDLILEQNRQFICLDLFITYIIIQNIQYNCIHVTYSYNQSTMEYSFNGEQH